MRVKKKLDIYKFIRIYLKYSLIDPAPSALPKTLQIWPGVRTVRIGMPANTRLPLWTCGGVHTRLKIRR
jgi:hypothetical protein